MSENNDEPPKWSIILNEKFGEEFLNYPRDQQEAVVDFMNIVQTHGLDNFDAFKGKGKIKPSWAPPAYLHSDNYEYAKTHNLWHYHLGIPYYQEGRGEFLTSDWLLHFQWNQHHPTDKYNIYLADCSSHYRSNGIFYLPSQPYLVKK